MYVNGLWCNLNKLIFGVNNNFKNLRISYEKNYTTIKTYYGMIRTYYGMTRIFFMVYRKISIDRPGGIHIFSTHIFCTIHKRTKIKAYSERVDSFLSEYAFIVVIWQVVKKLCDLKKWIPPVYLSSFYGTSKLHPNV